MTEAKFEGAERLHRSRARAWILQIHYKWESEGCTGPLAEALRATMATRHVSPRRLPYVRRVLALMDAHLREIDDALRAALDNWRLERLSSMDRAVLRIGATEILFVVDVPPKVAIQEGIHLAEAYGGPDSPRFVNGVLDALYKGRALP